jgi:hypothetical protein
MRRKTTIGISLAAIAALGAALVAMGAVTDGDKAYRSGVGILLIGLSCLVMHRSHCNTTKLIEHQTALAELTQQDQQRWAERGYRAGELDASHRPQQSAPVILLSSVRTPRKQHNGA